MNKLRTIATVTGSLVGLSLAGLALAGQGGGHHGHHGRAGGALGAHFFERLDTNKDGQLTRAEAEGEAQRLFERLDASKDGELTRPEADEGMRAVAQEEIEARFKALDTNGDGRVTADESKLPARFFDHLDKNDDQAVTREELQAGPHLGAKGTGFMFKKADANGDGKVSRAEGTQAALQGYDRLDGNRDGVITRAELDTRKEKKSGRHRKQGGEGATKS
jgi:Ca2+-binding EF-hand superfamily protein